MLETCLSFTEQTFNPLCLPHYSVSTDTCLKHYVKFENASGHMETSLANKFLLTDQ